MKRKEMMKQTMAFTLALSMLGGLACTVSASEPEKKDTWLSDEMGNDHLCQTREQSAAL